VLEAVFILLEFSSPPRKFFIGSHSLPPPSLVRRIGPSGWNILFILWMWGCKFFYVFRMTRRRRSRRRRMGTI
jgi:hypothetical protein